MLTKMKQIASYVLAFVLGFAAGYGIKDSVTVNHIKWEILPFDFSTNWFEKQPVSEQSLAGPSERREPWKDQHGSSSQIDVAALRPAYSHSSEYRLRCSDCTRCHLTPYCSRFPPALPSKVTV